MKTKTILRVVAPLVVQMAVLLSATAVGHAQPGAPWQLLGESHVDGNADHDKIKVTSSKGEFKAIRIRVEDAAIEFDRVLVHFGNGNSVPIQLRAKIPAGGQTRVIDLPGNERIVESVEFWYARGNMNNPNKPMLKLYGRP